MTCGEMVKLLKEWDESKPVGFCIANPSKRVFYEINWIKAIKDLDEPTFVIEISGETPFSEELRRAADREVHA